MTTYSSNIRNGTGFIRLEIRQESQNIANNTSTVYYKLYIQGEDGYGFWNEFNSGQTSVYINGSRVHYQTGRNFNIRGGGTQQLASGTTTVKHSEDGSKQFTFSASLWSSSATGSISGNFNLSKIPRKSDFSVKNQSGSKINSFYAGDKLTIDIDKKVSSFNHTLSIKYLDQEETLISKTRATSISYTTSNKIMENYMKTLRSMYIDFVLITYDGNTRIGYEVKRLTINVPSYASPVINRIDVKEANKNKINIIGETPFYQLLSNLNIVTTASPKYGASIKNISVSMGNLIRTGSNVILENVNLKGKQNIKVTVQDSRGLSTSTTKDINLSPYNLPNISFFNAYRNQSNSKYASARISLTATVIDNKNPLNVKVDVAEKDSNSWKNVYAATVGNGSFNSTISLGGGFDDFKAYDVRISIADKFKRHQALATIPATSQSLVIGADKPVVGIGKVPTIDKGLEVDGLLQVGGDSQKTLVLKGNKSSGAMLEWNIDDKRSNWICSWGNNLEFSGNVYFRDSIFLNGDIKYLQGNEKKIINLSLTSGLSGYIKARKDPFGGVNVWGEVTINNDNLRKKWVTWAVLPSGYLPKYRIPFDMYTHKLNYGSYIVQGMAVTEKGDITYIGMNYDQNELRNGWYNYFNFYFKPEEAW